MAFYIHGIMAIISEWLRTDCDDSIEYIIKVIQQCVKRHREGK
jgi:transcriptional regulator, tetR family